MKILYNHAANQWETESGIPAHFILSGYVLVESRLFTCDQIHFTDTECKLRPIDDMKADVCFRGSLRPVSIVFAGTLEGAFDFLRNEVKKIVRHYKSDLDYDIEAMQILSDIDNLVFVYYPISLRESGVDSLSFIESRSAWDYLENYLVVIDTERKNAAIYICQKENENHGNQNS